MLVMVKLLLVLVVWETIPAEALGSVRLCGPELADALALICRDKGYNYALMPEDFSDKRRSERGVVDECCKRNCLRRTLEQYCSPESRELNYSKKVGLQIRKRSDLQEDRSENQQDYNLFIKKRPTKGENTYKLIRSGIGVPNQKEKLTLMERKKILQSKVNAEHLKTERNSYDVDYLDLNDYNAGNMEESLKKFMKKKHSERSIPKKRSKDWYKSLKGIETPYYRRKTIFYSSTGQAAGTTRPHDA